MDHKVALKHILQFQIDEGRMWLDEHVGDDNWRYLSSMGGTIHIRFNREEDKCLFILKYGEYIA